ncbi:hypothetical protein Tco_0417514 [Tanacetum coccineum]
MDAKTLLDAIQTRFRGNDDTRKTQKTLLKQMYENFNAPSTESLDSIFNRLQKIVSQLAILGENISQEDLNLKFCRSLPSTVVTNRFTLIVLSTLRCPDKENKKVRSVLMEPKAKLGDIRPRVLKGPSRLPKEGNVLRGRHFLSTIHFLKFSENSFEVLKLLENSVKVLKILNNKLESMKILENKLESLKLQENQPVDRLVYLFI